MTTRPIALVDHQHHTISTFSSAFVAVAKMCEIATSAIAPASREYRVINRTTSTTIAYARHDADAREWHITIRRNPLWDAVSTKTKSSAHSSLFRPQ